MTVTGGGAGAPPAPPLSCRPPRSARAQTNPEAPKPPPPRPRSIRTWAPAGQLGGGEVTVVAVRLLTVWKRMSALRPTVTSPLMGRIQAKSAGAPGGTRSIVVEGSSDPCEIEKNHLLVGDHRLALRHAGRLRRLKTASARTRRPRALPRHQHSRGRDHAHQHAEHSSVSHVPDLLKNERRRGVARSAAPTPTMCLG